MVTLHQDQATREDLALDLDEIVSHGARSMLGQALEAEVETYIEAARLQRDEHRRALLVRKGRARECEILCGAEAVEIRVPRVNDRRVDEHGERTRFRSLIVPPHMRRSA